MSATRTNRKVLVVEDDLTLKVLIEKVLQSIDPEIQMDWTTTVDEALMGLSRKSAAWGGTGYDLIIADIFTPGTTNGYDLWDTCQKRFPDVPILITSGTTVYDFLRSISTLDRKSQASIAPPFLEKPLALGRCKQVIRHLLGYPPEHQEAG